LQPDFLTRPAIFGLALGGKGFGPGKYSAMVWTTGAERSETGCEQDEGDDEGFHSLALLSGSIAKPVAPAICVRSWARCGRCDFRAKIFFATFPVVPGFHGINTFISMNTSAFIKLASTVGLTAVVAFINPVAAIAILAGAGVIGITVTDYRARRVSFSGLAA